MLLVMPQNKYVIINTGSNDISPNSAIVGICVCKPKIDDYSTGLVGYKLARYMSIF